MSGRVHYVSSTFNTGPMDDFQGAWANDTDTGDIVGPATLPDNSTQGNPGTVTGTITRVKMNRCLWGIRCEGANTVTLAHDGNGILYGWYRTNDGVWRYFDDASTVDTITVNANDYVLNGATGSPVDYGLLVIGALI